MGLHAEAPARTAEAVFHRGGGVGLPVRAVHRLEVEALEVQVLELLGEGVRLRVDQLQFLA